MAELVDALVSGTSTARCGGSSPLLGTSLRCAAVKTPRLMLVRAASTWQAIGAKRTDESDIMKIRLHKGDLPDGLDLGRSDCCRHRDPRPQSARATGSASCSCRPAMAARISCSSPATSMRRPISSACSADPNVLKLYHFARFDLATLRRYLGVLSGPVYCTRTASKLARTYTDKHGLKDLVKELLDIDLSKQQQSSDWGARDLDRAAAGLRRQRRRLSPSAEGCAWTSC